LAFPLRREIEPGCDEGETAAYIQAAMIDLHTHLLPGIDDGPETMTESLELAAALVADGVTVAACTPHVRDDHGTTPEAMETALAALRAALDEAGIPLEVRGGGEIALERLPLLQPEARSRYGLGGNPALLLLEFPYYGWPLALPAIVDELASEGIVPVLAHPERSPEVHEDPERLRPIVAAGAYVQLTAASLSGEGRASRCGRTLLERGLAHLAASDAHGRAVTRAGLGSVRRALGDEALAEWLTTAVPRALVEGSPPPPRPLALARRRRRRA
jgi:protein-tyrosine phosphatase